MMRKLTVGLIVAGLLACAGHVQAQDNGRGDPLGLIASAAIQPFWSSGANFTVFEITSPVSDNAKPNSLHAIFFDATCVRQFSAPLPVTENGLLVFNSLNFDLDFNGLAVIARTENQIGLTPIPLEAPIHVRGHWVNFVNDHIRVIDPISVSAAESLPAQTWNPMRSGVDFVTPVQCSVFSTTLFLVCPSSTITGVGSTGTVTGVLPTDSGFPEAPRFAYGTTATSGIVGVIYDDDENPLRNIQVPCVCITPLSVTAISSVYGQASNTGASGLFYTELFTLPVPVPDKEPVSPAFTGYRSIVVSDSVWPGGSGDKFGRLTNGSSDAYRGSPAIGAR
jgi:hypothetical protein